MRVAVVHYHYRPGGVTRVVENAFASMQGQGITAVAVSGEPYTGGKMPVRLQAGLRYSQPNEKISTGPLWYSLKMAVRQALGGEPDVWHFHNPALGKNSAMAEVVGKIAAEAPVLLQFHDFAEDGRPQNYAMLRGQMENIERLYPQGGQVHYAALNARDHAFMLRAGFNRENVHLLPNPVCVGQGQGAYGAGAGAASGDSTNTNDAAATNYAGGSMAGSSYALGVGNVATGVGGASAGYRALSASSVPVARSGFSGGGAQFGPLAGLGALKVGQALYLYPTRAIRRKNLGEFLLLAALGSADGRDALFATTLEPENPQARPVYERWVAFARAQGLPVAFGVGQGRGAPDFPALMRRGQAVVSTSVAEGFGLAFLEPWLFGKPVLGRNLPEITADFATQGIALGNLYTRLPVPRALVDIDALRQKLTTGLANTFGAYCRPLPQDAVEVALAAICDAEGNIDFGALDEPLQEKVIEAVANSAELRAQLAPFAVDYRRVPPEQIEANALAVEQNYSLPHYGERLATLYRQVAASPRTPLQYAPPSLLLDQFLGPERFCLLRT